MIVDLEKRWKPGDARGKGKLESVTPGVKCSKRDCAADPTARSYPVVCYSNALRPTNLTIRTTKHPGLSN